MKKIKAIFTSAAMLGVIGYAYAATVSAAGGDRSTNPTNGPSSHVRVIAEKPMDENALMNSIKSGGRVFGRNELSGIEFTDTKGKVKRINLQEGASNKKEVENLIDIKISKNDKHVVVSRIAHDTKERNPYALRQSSATELVWYTDTGEESGRRFFNQTSRAKAVSNDGLLTIVVDEGFDPESLSVYRDVPKLKSTEPLKQDSSLVDHLLYVLSEKGEIIITRKIKGPGSAPDNIEFSPSGEWFVYTVGSKDLFVNNIKTKVEEKVALGSVGWRVSDKGELYSWRSGKKGGHWGKQNGEQVWIPDEQVEFALYVKRQGASGVVKTEQIEKLGKNEFRTLREPEFNSDGLIKEK